MNIVYIHIIGRDEPSHPGRIKHKRDTSETSMKTIIASIVALGLLAGAASASTLTPVQADTTTADWCKPYYGH